MVWVWAERLRASTPRGSARRPGLTPMLTSTPMDCVGSCVSAEARDFSLGGFLRTLLVRRQQPYNPLQLSAGMPGLRIRRYMGLTERSAARYSHRIRPSVRCVRPQIGYWRAGRRAFAESSGCPSICPSDRRHTATCGGSRRQREGQIGTWRWRATPPDTPDGVSTTAGRRCDSCPTCPSLMLNS
jgi:hypothetical protein